MPLVELALAEDLGTGDVTSAAVLPADLEIAVVVEAREPLVVCGLRVAEAVFLAVDPELQVEPLAAEGGRADAGQPLIEVRGSARSALAAERTVLNFLGRLCGVASFTRRFVDTVAGTGVAIVDTRKTLPGFRSLDKVAVATGGGTNHRAGLYDAILIKDNHVAAAGGVGPAVKAARASAPPHLQIQVEVESEEQAEDALEAGAQLLLLDNRSLPELRRLAERFRDRIPLEATGGVRLEQVRALAETGVHRISIGALTHSAPNADLAIEVIPREAAEQRRR
ncbi:MAG: nicotinate-nucleotide diphosphorylase (carboxylating) [Deltaproteobacteria bacterium]|jgi:nicotinate-nucleotide pyrophosphorylase (carboxylating)|nr:nicotinate-nucleotide diphosphorylase (carboxylating) [Deltaproteobacteria bacterium]